LKGFCNYVHLKLKHLKIKNLGDRSAVQSLKTAQSYTL
jgi:hypothetical protein